MGWITKVLFGTMAIMAVGMGLVLYLHNSVFVLDGPDNGFLLTKDPSVRYSIYLPAFYAHVFTGSVVLLTGVLQFVKGIRARNPAWHRTLGKVYVFVILILTAPSGMIMSLYANGGIVARTGFAVLALLWWYFTWRGLQFALRMDWQTHRKFMLRSYALTFSAVTLRLYSFVFALAGFRGESIYNLIVWLSWVPSLLLVELWIARTSQRTGAPA